MITRLIADIAPRAVHGGLQRRIGGEGKQGTEQAGHGSSDNQGTAGDKWHGHGISSCFENS
ncbi:MAG: hypothetical protein PW788_15625 [Micavibrio sp.]|nr:hypothetical protein [Micavibrio sp.]